jgi:hypothetical protein
MKNTASLAGKPASLAEAARLIEYARAAGLTVTTENETFSCGSFDTTTINARRAGSGHRDEWVQVIVSVRRLGRASVSIATQTNWHPESVRGLWHAQFNLREIVNGLTFDAACKVMDDARAKSAAVAREENAALAETRRCLCCS